MDDAEVGEDWIAHGKLLSHFLPFLKDLLI